MNGNQSSGGMPPVPTDEMPRRRNVKPLMSLRNHPRLALGTAIFLLIAGLPYAWIKGKAVYTSVAGVQIFPTYVANLREPQEVAMPSTTQYRQFVQQQMRTIARFDIVEKALEKLPPKARELWQDEDETNVEGAENLQKALLVEEVPETYLVTVGIEGNEPEGLAETVNTVVHEYIRTFGSEKLYGADERIANLADRRKEIVVAMEERIERENLASQELGMASFEGDKRTPYDETLNEATNALANATRARIEAEAAFESMEASLARTDRLPLEAQAETMMAEDLVLVQSRTQFLKRRNELLLELNLLGERHPARRGLEREIGEIDAELASFTRASLDHALAILSEKRRVKTDRELSVLRAAVEEARLEEVGMRELLEKQREKASWFSRRYNEGRALHEKIKEDREKIAEIDRRVEYLTLEDKAPGLVRLVTPARNNDIPLRGGRKKVYLLFIVAAAVFAVAVPVAVDLVDHRIHAPNDLERLLGFAPLGWQLDRSDGRVESFAKDLSRRLAIAIDRDRRRQGTKELVLTAVSPGDGTTTLALETARELAALGVRAIAVEGNAFKPDPRYQGSKRSRGLIAALEGDPLEELIVPREAGLPDRLPVGNIKHDEVHHLRSLERLPALLEVLNAKYDLVLIDAPPVLLSADTEILCQSTSGTLLVVGAEGVWPGQILRAARVIERLAPPVVGTIVNRVRVYDNGGYLTETLHSHESGQPPAVPLLARLLWS